MASREGTHHEFASVVSELITRGQNGGTRVREIRVDLVFPSVQLREDDRKNTYKFTDLHIFNSIVSHIFHSYLPHLCLSFG